MELMAALETITTHPEASGSDMAIARRFLAKGVEKPEHKKYAKALVKKYGLGEKKKVGGEVQKRAALRDGRILLVGALSNKEKDEITKIPGREFNPKGIFLPLNSYTLKVLRAMEFTLSNTLIEWEEKNRPEVSVDGFDERLYPFQIEGIKRIEALDGNVLLSDEVGLGKTAQVAVYLKRNPEINPILIICPSGLRLNWQKELRSFGCEHEIKVINGKKDKLPKTGITIMSYNVAFDYYCEAEDMGYKALICDESQALIHIESKRTKAVRYLSRGIEKRIMISATPLTSRPKNLFTQLNLINRDMFNSMTHFVNTYCGGKSDPAGNGCTNSAQLHQILSDSMMIRRKRKDVMDQLPSKTYQIIPIEISKTFRDEYEFAQKEIVQYIKENYGPAAANRARFGEVMVRMEHLKQIAVKAKMDDSIEYIRTITDSGEPVVVFATHKFVIERLVQEFGESCLKIDGSLSVKQKQANIEQFQSDEKIMVMACNIQAGSTGVTLTRANHVIFVQFSWLPSDLIQGVGRIDRIGQKCMSLSIHYIVASETIDETICNILDKKSRVIGDILDDGMYDEGVLLNELIEQFKNK